METIKLYTVLTMWLITGVAGGLLLGFLMGINTDETCSTTTNNEYKPRIPLFWNLSDEKQYKTVYVYENDTWKSTNETVNPFE